VIGEVVGELKVEELVPEWGWWREIMSWFQRHGEACRKAWSIDNLRPCSFLCIAKSYDKWMFWNLLPQLFAEMEILNDGILNLVIWLHFGSFMPYFPVHVQKWLFQFVFWVKIDITVQSSIPNFLTESDILIIWGHFHLILSLDKPKVRHVFYFLFELLI